MSQDNVEIVRQMTEAAFSGEEPERALDALDAEVEFDLTGRPDARSGTAATECCRRWRNGSTRSSPGK
jgi:hypothetical protein